jgi:hypothetical protein
MQLAPDDSPFGQIVRQPIPPAFEWEGDLTLSFPNSAIDGPGALRADRTEVGGHVTHVDEKLLAAAARGPVLFRPDYHPGIMLTGDRYADAAPREGGWSANACVIIARQIGDGFQFREIFGCRRVSVTGPSQKAPAYLRVFYASAHLSSPTQGTIHERGWSRDAIEGIFQGRRLHLRNLNGSEVRIDEQVVGATTSADLDEDQLTALWLSVGFVSGNGVLDYCREYYDGDGVLCKRVYEPRIPATSGRMQPFHLAYVPFRAEYLAVIGDGFYRMLAAGFPITVMLQHLHAATSGNIETDLQSLLLGIHTAIEAWNRAFGRVSLVPVDVWNAFRPALLRAVAPLDGLLAERLSQATREKLDAAGLIASITNKLNSANHTPTNQKERDLFATLQIPLSKQDRDALVTRNQLLHNGYFLKRFDELSPEEQQQRIDLRPRLRNLVHQIVLRLCGFRGTVLEMTRSEALQIDSTFTPLFGVGSEDPR